MSAGLAASRGPVTVVVNPVKVADAAALRKEIAEGCRRAGRPEPAWVETTEDDPGFSQARSAVDRGADLVVVCGGDGTVAACASALAGSGVAMAVVAGGTGNLLARNLEIPLDRAAALVVAFGEGRRTIDVVRSEPGRHFVVMAGLGFDAAMIAQTNDRTKARFGWPAYIGGIVRALRGSRATDFKIAVDGATPTTYRAVGVLAGNVGRLQAGLTVLPDAMPSDGILDVVVFAPHTWLDWPRIVGRLVSHRTGQGGVSDVLRGARFDIACDRSLPLEFDGELSGESTSLVLEVVPGALTVCVPTSSGQA
jgi:diacylglycerol kinase family enzyme